MTEKTHRIWRHLSIGTVVLCLAACGPAPMERGIVTGGEHHPQWTEMLQLRRTKGWRKPEGAIVVSRPSKWGNPWRVGDWLMTHAGMPCGPHYGREFIVTPEIAVAFYRQAFAPDSAEIRAELAGHDLACWCPLDQPCHADVLLEIANQKGQ